VAPGDQSNGMRNMLFKLKFLKSKIKEWINVFKNNSKAELIRIKGELQAVDGDIDNGNGSDEVVSKRTEIINSMLRLNKIKASEAAQKAKIKCRFGKPTDIRAIIDMNFPKVLSSVQKEELECDVSKEELKRTIIAKILTNRLVGLIGDIVNEVQSAFIVDRQILDGPFILNEVTHWVWGCRAVVRLLDSKLKTLGERDIECIFVRYAEHSKAFRFYVIELNDSVSINTIIESRDTIFDLNIFSSVPRPSLKIPNGTEDIGGLVVPKEVIEEVIQQPEPEFRKSKRNRTPKDFGPEFQLYLIEGTRDASQDVAFWKEAFNDEMDSIMGNNTWVLADLPPGCKPFGCKWFFKRKLKVDETIEKFKAMLVIQGFKQKSGIYYFDTYASVARISTIRLLIVMSLIHNLIIHPMDVKTSFLNGNLDEEVRHMMKQITSKGKGVLLEEIIDHDVNDAVRKEFDGESGNRVKRKGDIKIWFSDEDVDQGIDVEWKDDPYHLINEPKEISDIFADLDQALDELD
nr:zinc finger, CCHC-type [Tanacetum cinerariifolium]